MISNLVFLLGLSTTQAMAQNTATDPFQAQVEKSALNICNTTLSTQTNLPANWLQQESILAVSHLLKNISPTNLSYIDKKTNQVVKVIADPGTVVAARTDFYFYHWVRDAGLVMDTAVNQYRSSTDPKLKSALELKLNEYLNFSMKVQNLEAKTDLEKEKYTGLGEPKYNLNGTIFTDPWGRPQNDSPALRAISLMNWADVLIKEGKINFVRERLYGNQWPAQSVIKKDLEYVAFNWRKPSFDLWEEVKGDHFYTRMVQRKAMVEGARLARLLGDTGAADWYTQEAKEIEKSLMNFWDPVKAHFVATLNRVEGLDYKQSNLDTAVILGLLHGQTNDNFLQFSDPKVQATMDKLIDAFRNEYLINQVSGFPGIALGRYPEDQYAGATSGPKQGNPWVLTTLAIAEAYYKAAREMTAQGRTSEADVYVAKGDKFVERVKLHAHADGSLSEQIHRNSGHMTSVEDLTWNYAAVLTAFWARP